MRRPHALRLLASATLLGVCCFNQFSIVHADDQPVATENGDTNGDGVRDISDAVQLLWWLFLGGPEPVTIEAGGSPPIPGFTFSETNEQGYAEYTHNETGMVFVHLPGGDFDMGSVECEVGGREDHEGPVHRVRLSPFLIAKYECTQAQYEAVMGSNPSSLCCDPLRPVESVSFFDLHDAGGFLARTSLGLPTEAQWEYACRAGITGPYSSTGATHEMGWSLTNSGETTHPVGQKQPNQFGLHDMHGNVWEWCEDVLNSSFYETAAAAGPDPVSDSGSILRVLRGGAYDGSPHFFRSAFRRGVIRAARGSNLGFRTAVRTEVMPTLAPTASGGENGDTNGDGVRDISDAVQLLGWLFLGGPEPVEAGGPPPIPGFTFSETNEQGYPEYTHDLTGIVFVRLPGGEFDMGSVDCEEGRDAWEGPVHRVRLSPFLIAKYECTQAQYESVMGPHPSSIPGNDSHPVVMVSWNDLTEPGGFLARTNLILPSEAQWEYACRAGLSGPFSGTGDIDEMGWIGLNIGGTTHPVGLKQPNQFGLHDMHGNVEEWCQDYMSHEFYGTPAASVLDPVSRFPSGSFRMVVRGGWYGLEPQSCRSAFRYWGYPTGVARNTGFRPAARLP